MGARDNSRGAIGSYQFMIFIETSSFHSSFLSVSCLLTCDHEAGECFVTSVIECGAQGKSKWLKMSGNERFLGSRVGRKMDDLIRNR